MNINIDKIKHERATKAWSQQHLADACAVSLRTIQRVENNGTASLETVKALASCFELDVKELFLINESKRKKHSKTKITTICAAIIALLSTSVYLVPSSMASGIQIKAEQVNTAIDKHYQAFTGNVEILIPKNIPVDISTDAIWGTDAASVASGRVKVHLDDSTLVIDQAVIINVNEGIKVTTDYAEKHYKRTRM